MNTFVDKYSTTSAASQLRRAQRLAEEDEFSDAAWGSEAGFGNIVKGAPSFNVPNVADVSFMSGNAASDAILNDYP